MKNGYVISHYAIDLISGASCGDHECSHFGNGVYLGNPEIMGEKKVFVIMEMVILIASSSVIRKGNFVINFALGPISFKLILWRILLFLIRYFTVIVTRNDNRHSHLNFVAFAEAQLATGFPFLSLFVS